MAFRKNKKFIDPRYFMDEKTDIIKEGLEAGAPGKQTSVIDQIESVPGLADKLESNKDNARGETMSGTWRSAAKYNQDSYDAIAQAFGVSNEEAYDVYMNYFRALRGRS
jgi:hypothetical protein